jgi:hypothetical protein
MMNHSVATELKEKAILQLIPSYDWTLLHVADETFLLSGSGVNSLK